MDQLLVLLRGADVRRAAIAENGMVVDVKIAGGAEQHVLSKSIEMLKIHLGVPVYSRDPDELLTMCFRDNDAKAWECACDDITTGDITPTVLRTNFKANPVHVSLFSRCLLESRGALHALSIARLLAASLPGFDSNEQSLFKASMHHKRGYGVLKLVCEHCRSLAPQLRRDALRAFSTVVNDCAHIVADMVKQTTSVDHDIMYVLSLCPDMHLLPPALVDALVPFALTHARGSPPHRRWFTIAILAKVAALAEHFAPEMQRLAVDTVQACSTPETLGACAALLCVTSDDATTLSLARAVCVTLPAGE